MAKTAAAAALTEKKRCSNAARWRTQTSACTAASVRDAPAAVDQIMVIQQLHDQQISTLE
jgi:hypothetical protein